MSGSEPNFLNHAAGSGGGFATTRWTMVLCAGNQDLPQSGPALEQLCRNYWYPLYACVRRQGHADHEAQDLTQGFFSRLLESKGLDAVHPDKGRFRSFLSASLNHFLANEWKHSRRLKRGGGKPHFSLDADAAETRYQHEPPDHLTPEKIFERRWAEALLQGVLDRLRAEWEQNEPARDFEDMKPFLLGDRCSERMADAAVWMGLTEGSLKWAVRRLRQRYREIFREEIAHTVSCPDDIDDEIRYLFSVLAD